MALTLIETDRTRQTRLPEGNARTPRTGRARLDLSSLMVDLDELRKSPLNRPNGPIFASSRSGAPAQEHTTSLDGVDSDAA